MLLNFARARDKGAYIEMWTQASCHWCTCPPNSI